MLIKTLRLVHNAIRKNLELARYVVVLRKFQWMRRLKDLDKDQLKLKLHCSRMPAQQKKIMVITNRLIGIQSRKWKMEKSSNENNPVLKEPCRRKLCLWKRVQQLLLKKLKLIIHQSCLLHALSRTRRRRFQRWWGVSMLRNENTTMLSPQRSMQSQELQQRKPTRQLAINLLDYLK